MKSKPLLAAGIGGAILVASVAGGVVSHLLNSDFFNGAIFGAIGATVGTLTLVYMRSAKNKEKNS